MNIAIKLLHDALRALKLTISTTPRRGPHRTSEPRSTPTTPATARALLAATATLAATTAAHAQFTETEPNDNKATANLITLSNGGTITGSSTGELDYFRIKTASLPSGLYKHTLTFNSSSSLVGAEFTIRGLNQTSSVIGTTDITVQTASPTVTPINSLTWYGFGKQEELYIRVAGTALMTSPYVATLTTSSVAASPISGAIASGDLTINCNAGPAPAIADSEVWLYDSSFTPVPTANNDDKGGAAPASTLSTLKRSIAPGTYFLAVHDFNLANDQPSPLDDVSRSAAVLDFPSALVYDNSSTGTAPNYTARNFVVSISQAGFPDVTAGAATPTQLGSISWFTFTVLPRGACFPGAVTGPIGIVGSRANNFSTALAISADTAVIGARFEDTPDTGGTDEGAAYVYIRSGSSWVLQQRLVAGDPQTGSAFGNSVAIDNNTIVIGAPFSDGGLGSAYVFVRSGSTWSQQAKLQGSGAEVNDIFAAVVGVSGDNIVVGASADDDPVAGIDTGSAYFFTRIGTTWISAGKVIASDAAASDSFANRVAISGNTTVIGSVTDDFGSLTNPGSAYVFVKSSTGWTQQAKLVASDAASFDFFAQDVAISGDTIVIGAWQSDAAPLANNGAAYVFTRSGNTWTQQAKLTASNASTGAFFGNSVSIDGNLILVGAPGNGAGTFAGAAYLFSRLGSAWREVAFWTPSDSLVPDGFATAVRISARNIAAYSAFRPEAGLTYLSSMASPGADGLCDTCYGGALAVQNSNTSAGNSSTGNVDLAEGSELVGLHSRILDATLYLTLTGNLKFESDSLELFFDTAVGGQSTLHTNNPNVAYGALTRMAGFTFESGFAPDYYLTVAGGSIPSLRQVDYASLPTAGAGLGRFLGYVDASADGTLTAGSNPDNIRVAIDNRNTAGVAAGTSTATPPATIRTGVEIAIPLAALGNPACDVKVMAFINGANHASVSNQFLPGVGGRAALGEPRTINLNNIPAAQFATATTQPSIVTQPLSVNACAGFPATFAVVAQNAASFQWRRNAVNLSNGAGISGATSASLSIASAAAANVGSYDCVITGPCGSPITSNSASLAVDDSTLALAPFKITASDASSADQLGFPTTGASPASMSGDTLVIGAPLNDLIAGADAGAAYVFIRSGATWVQQAQLVAFDAAANDLFGWSCSISGDTIVIGSPGDDTAAGVNSGSAYVYTRTGSTWTLQAKITPIAAAAGDSFGRSVGISADRIVVGADTKTVGANANQGAAFVFLRTANIWQQESGTISASDGAASDIFGTSVAISGDTIAISSPLSDSPTDSGAVYVYTRLGSNWTERQKVRAPDAAVSDVLSAVALEGNTLVAGARQADVSGRNDQGAAYVFRLNGPTFYPDGKITAVDGLANDWFGLEVAVSGDRIVVGAHQNDTLAVNAGAAYTFVRQASAVTPLLTYVSQSRSISANCSASGQSQSFSAPGFSVFNQTATASGTSSTQNTNFGPTSIVGTGQAAGSTVCATAGGTNSSNLNVSFTINQSSTYTFVYSATTTDSIVAPIISLTGPGTSITLTQGQFNGPPTTVNGTFAPGTYTLAATAVGGRLTPSGPGQTSSWNVNLSLTSAPPPNLWYQESKLLAPDGAANDQFGSWVGISGSVILVGASGDDFGAFTDAGSAWLFNILQPVSNVTVAAGATANFPLLYTPPAGANAQFQWRRNSAPLANGPTGAGSTISGANSATLSIANAGASDVGAYECLITNACGSLLSRAATLALSAGLPIVASPQSARACRGQPTVFVAADVGASLPDLQWQVRNPALSSDWIGINTGPLSSGPVRGSVSLSPDHRELTWSGSWASLAPAELQFRCICQSNPDTSLSSPATLSLCPADFNCSGTVGVQDIFDFLLAWFASDPRADVNLDNTISVQDAFDFLTTWFTGCPNI